LAFVILRELINIRCVDSHFVSLLFWPQFNDWPPLEWNYVKTSRHWNARINRNILFYPCFFHSQETILKQLGISPHAADHWPLYIGPRSLSILARVLLGRQDSCRETGDECDDESCVKTWQRLILTLREMAFNERRRPGR
jgi:hypothetical protein